MCQMTRSSVLTVLALLTFSTALALSVPFQALNSRQFRLSHKLDAALLSDPTPNRLVYNPLARLVSSADQADIGGTALLAESAVLDYAQADGTTLVSCTDPRVVFTPAAGSGPSWRLARSPASLLGASKSIDPASLPRSSFPPSLSFTFLGTGLVLFGPRSPQHGQALVRLDGRPLATLDAFGKFKPRQRLWAVRDLPHGMHTVEVVPTGGKQRRGEGVVVEVEGFGVVGLGGGGKQRVGSFAGDGGLGRRGLQGEGEEEWEVLGY